MKKSPWLAIRETFADTPEYNRRTPIAKRFKYAQISAKKTPQFPIKASDQNEAPSNASCSSKTTPLSSRNPTSRFKFSSHKRAINLAEIIDDDEENHTKQQKPSPSRRKNSQPLLSICNTPEVKDRLVIDESSCESVTFDPDYDDYRIDTILTAKSSTNPLKCVSKYRRTAPTSRRLSSVCSNLSGRFVQHPESIDSIVALESQANEANSTQIVVPGSQHINWFTSPNFTSSTDTIIQNSQVIEAFESEPTVATQNSIEFRIDEANTERIIFTQLPVANSTENLGIIWSNSGTKPCPQISSNKELAVTPNIVVETPNSQPHLSICKTPEAKDRQAIDESSCESVTFDPDYNDYRIDTILMAKFSSNPLKCVSKYCRTEETTSRLSSVRSNLSGRSIEHPESPSFIVDPDSQANEANSTHIVVPDSQTINFTIRNPTTMQNSQVIEAFESEPTVATQNAIEFRIDESNTERIICPQISSNEELAVTPKTFIETPSSEDTPPTVKSTRIDQYTKQKKPLRPKRGGLLEELLKCNHKAQSEYNFWHNMRRAGVAVQHNVMMVTGVEESYGRILVYAENVERDSNAEECRALFTFDGNLQFCSRLKEGVQFEVNLSDSTGYSIRNGVFAYPAVKEILLL